jgi:hypothetical protein
VPKSTERRIPAPGVRSLVWDGDDLIDWVGGGARYGLDGEMIEPRVYYAYSFDAAVALSGSDFAVIYKRLATKGLVLRCGQVVREINRSFYCAGSYEYPITLFRLPSGRAVLAHCPQDYCRLDIEDLATGELLTQAGARKPADIFHSRLAVSPDGRYLMSAGWVWHPMDCVSIYDIEAALADPTHLDGPGIRPQADAEESSAVFLGDGRLAVALLGEIDADEADSQSRLRIFDDVRSNSARWTSTVDRLGSLAAIGRNHLLALYGHPRLIDMRSGKEVLSWPHIRSGMQTTSIMVTDPEVPPMAVDSDRSRFAIADAEGITVVQIETETPALS